MRSFLALGLVGVLAGCSAQDVGPADVPDAAPDIDAPVDFDAPVPDAHVAAPDAHVVTPDAHTGPDAKPVVVTAYRLSDITLLDAHVFVYIDAFQSCIDGTDLINSAISDRLNKDADGDGNLDLGLVLLMEPLDQKAGDTPTAAFVSATCTAPTSSSTCNGAGAASTSATVTNQGTGTCIAPAPGSTTASYSPNIQTPAGPCFATVPTSYSFMAGGATITLLNAAMGAAYSGTPATSLTRGLMRGFISEADANNITIDLSAVGGGMVPLSQLFAGGTGSCVTDHSDKDTGPSGQPGWYLYFNFTAVEVPYTQ